MLKIMKSHKDFDQTRFNLTKRMNERQRGNLTVVHTPSFFPCLMDIVVSYENSPGRYGDRPKISPYMRCYYISRSRAKKLLYRQHLNIKQMNRLGIIENTPDLKAFLTRTKYDVVYINRNDDHAKKLCQQQFEKFDRKVLGNLGFPLMVIASPVGSYYGTLRNTYMHPNFSFLTLNAAKEFIHLDKNTSKQHDKIADLKKEIGVLSERSEFQQYVHSITGGINNQKRIGITKGRKKSQKKSRSGYELL